MKALEGIAQVVGMVAQGVMLLTLGLPAMCLAFAAGTTWWGLKQGWKAGVK